MRIFVRWPIGVLIVAGIVATGCTHTPTPERDAEAPANVENIAGSSVDRVTLSVDAAQRLGIETAAVREGRAGSILLVPYAAVIYDQDGATWVYTNPEPRVFVRSPIRVARIRGTVAVLSDGPPPGTAVVVVGAAELLGAEYGVGEE